MGATSLVWKGAGYKFILKCGAAVREIIEKDNNSKIKKLLFL